MVWIAVGSASWTLGVFLAGLWLGRRSKWEETHDVEPVFPNIKDKIMATKEPLEGRNAPRTLLED